MKSFFTMCSLVLFTLVVCEEKIRYDNYTVHKIIPQTGGQLKALKKLQEERLDIDFWKEPSFLGRQVHVMIGPNQRDFFNNFLEDNHFNSTVYMKDVQLVIDQQHKKPRIRSISTGFNFKDFHRLDTIYNYLADLAHLYPQNVKIVQGGRSFEGRNITGVYVSFSPSNRNKTIFLEGGIHGREWISPSTVLYLLSQILTSNDDHVLTVAQKFDWIVFPVFNPDGYEHSHTNDRMWRKTRKPNDNCVGTDPNRNWGFHWNSAGSNSFGCSETYAGSKAFSEDETKSMSEFISKIHNRLYAYFAFHSYGQFILCPYGYTFQPVSNYNELKKVAEKAVDSIYNRYQTEFFFGTLAESTNFAHGSSIDWVKGTYGTRFVFLYELRDTGENGFILPPEQIIPTGEETLDSLLTLIDETSKL